MASDAEIVLAFVAKRQGKQTMSATEWSNVLSLELGWMAPAAAASFVADCSAYGLLVEDQDGLRPGFDHSAVTIPKRYRPPPDLGAPTSAPPAKQAAAGLDPFTALLERIVQETDLSKDGVLDEVTSVQERFGGRLSADAAAVRVALVHGIDVEKEARDLLSVVTSRSR